MGRVLLVAAFTVLALMWLSTAAANAETPADASPKADAETTAATVSGRYIVTVKAGNDANEIASAVRANPTHLYRSALNGFAAALNDGQLNALRHNPKVEAIEADQVASTQATQYMNSAGDPWGLDRIDQRSLPLSRTYFYSRNGYPARAYVIDTGVQSNHPDYNGRGYTIYNATTGTGTDCHGHGTHVAGTIAGTTWGVAKGALIRGVKVLGCDGRGSYADIIEGIDWVRANAIKPAVANMSLGGGYSSAVNTATNNLSNSGVLVAVAAGNDNLNACNYSPASAANAFTTASSTRYDQKSSFSNYGACVDGYAPGSNIKSSTLGGGSGWMSGTSMASPHVAGVGALLCSYGATYCTPSYITSWIKNNATIGKISGNPAYTSNRLLWKGSL
ncbi:MAG: S8 family peptidase [Solirubrobacterales bacterium]|nr:S8 family peptidase [Solirubrobacterales bacterium]